MKLIFFLSAIIVLATACTSSDNSNDIPWDKLKFALTTDEDIYAKNKVDSVYHIYDNATSLNIPNDEPYSGAKYDEQGNLISSWDKFGPGGHKNTRHYKPGQHKATLQQNDTAKYRYEYKADSLVLFAFGKKDSILKYKRVFDKDYREIQYLTYGKEPTTTKYSYNNNGLLAKIYRKTYFSEENKWSYNHSTMPVEKITTFYYTGQHKDSTITQNICVASKNNFLETEHFGPNGLKTYSTAFDTLIVQYHYVFRK